MIATRPFTDAVRSRISGGDVGSAIRDVAFQQFDISQMKEILVAGFLHRGARNGAALRRV